MLRAPSPECRQTTTYCALTTTFFLLLLLLSLFFLNSRFSTQSYNVATTPFTIDDQDSDFDVKTPTTPFDDRIDDDSKSSNNEQEILRSLDFDAEDSSRHHHSGFYFDHVSHVFRRQLDFQSVDDVQRWSDYATPFIDFDHDESKVVFGSDDVPVDEGLRVKLVKVNGIEDARFLKLGSMFSPLREGWGGWFNAKGDFLKKDRFFKSKLEMLNPGNNPLLQDPDGTVVTVVTRGDKIVQKGLFDVMKKAPIILTKSVGISNVNSSEVNMNHPTKRHISIINNKRWDRGSAEQEFHVDQKTDPRESENRLLNNDEFDALGGFALKGVYENSLRRNADDVGSSLVNMGKGEILKAENSIAHNKPGFLGSMYNADGRKWGHFPGLHPHLSFSNFIGSFFRKSKCHMRVFMVWNSPPWMYTVRYQRGFESLLFHHPNACVVVFSETIELNFFKEFLKDGFKIAVTMPNLEELLKDTPTSIFASVWNEWRTTKYYSTHYSELIRLAALYKYGGIYLDCDIVVLRPINIFSNSIGMEDLADRRSLNGAFMAFSKHSLFIFQCLLEFFSSYDDTLLRWNGADLLTRVEGNLSSKLDGVDKENLLKVQSASIFFPVSSRDIQRYFVAPITDNEKAYQDIVLRKILNESYTLHFWNSLTSTLVPEPYSLVARFMNKFCIRCLDIL